MHRHICTRYNYIPGHALLSMLVTERLECGLRGPGWSFGRWPSHSLDFDLLSTMQVAAMDLSRIMEALSCILGCDVFTMGFAVTVTAALLNHLTAHLLPTDVTPLSCLNRSSM